MEKKIFSAISLLYFSSLVAGIPLDPPENPVLDHLEEISSEMEANRSSSKYFIYTIDRVYYGLFPLGIIESIYKGSWEILAITLTFPVSYPILRGLSDSEILEEKGEYFPLQFLGVLPLIISMHGFSLGWIGILCKLTGRTPRGPYSSEGQSFHFLFGISILFLYSFLSPHLTVSLGYVSPFLGIPLLALYFKYYDGRYLQRGSPLPKTKRESSA